MTTPDSPESLRIWSGGFCADSYSLTFDGAELRYATGVCVLPPPEPLPTPKSEDWAAFRKELDAIGVWRWQAKYDAPDVLDGRQWTVSITWGDHRCEVHGSNKYPMIDGTPADTEDCTPTFARFLRAVRRLAGGKKFR